MRPDLGNGDATGAGPPVRPRDNVTQFPQPTAEKPGRDARLRRPTVVSFLTPGNRSASFDAFVQC
jgi:hypothetical protein